MLSLSSNHFSVPELKVHSVELNGNTYEICSWMVRDNSIPIWGEPNYMIIKDDFHWTVLPDSEFIEVDESGNFDWNSKRTEISGEERVTWLFTKDGRIRPSHRSLRIYGSEKIASFLKGMYVGGDPRKGCRYKGAVCRL